MEINITKISCEFVRQVLNLIKQKKYLANPCVDQVNYYFSLLKQSTTVYECLSYEEICNLSTIIDLLPENEPDPTVVIDCNDIALINITATQKACIYDVTLENLNGIQSSFPVLDIQADTIYQPAYINVKVKGCKESGTHTAETGCIETNPITCQLSFKQELELVYTLSGLLTDNPSGYIKNLRVYQTDSNGDVDPTPIDLNLAPSNIGAWTACPLCSGIPPAQLFFGNANWGNAFKALLDNVCYTLHGALTAEWSASKNTALGLIRIGGKIKHQPSGNWLGIDKNDFLVKAINQLGGELRITNPGKTIEGTPSRMAEDFVIPMECGNVTGRVSMFVGQFSPNHTSNWIDYRMNSLVSTVPAKITNLVSPTCVKTTLTATYTLQSQSAEVVYVAWLDPLGETISFDNTITVVDSGEYEFIIVFGDGCVASKTFMV